MEAGEAETGAGSRWRVAPARAAETGQLAALGAGSLAGGWSPAAIAAELARPDARAWTLRGPAGAAPLGFLVARRVLDELHVLLVAVAPACRRSGGGSALVRAALAAARAEGLASALLEVRAGIVAARALYARHGFLAVGRRPRYYEGREDAVLMSRRIDRGDAA